MSKEKAIVFNIQRFSTEDGPGIRTTVFFKGCPLRCLWCHNPEGINSRPEVLWNQALCMACGDCEQTCPQKGIRLDPDLVSVDRQACQTCGSCQDICPSQAIELVGKEYSQESLLEEVCKDKTFYETSQGGVTLSGGEPLLQHAFVTEFAKQCRGQKLHLALDTSGFGKPEWLEAVLPHVQLVLFDLKHADEKKHLALTGVELPGILENLKLIGKTRLPVWVRTPIIPDCTDSEENIKAISALIKTLVPHLERFDLLAFSNYCQSKYQMLGKTFPLAEKNHMDQSTMERLMQLVQQQGINCVQWSGPT